MTEAPIVVENREELIFLLSEASELEHMVMLAYLFAAFSLEQHPAPALYLPFQLGLKGVPLAQKEAIDVFLSGTRAGRRGLAWKVTYLAVGPLSCVAPFFCLLSHEKCLLCSLHPLSPVLWGRALKKKATRRSVHT